MAERGTGPDKDGERVTGLCSQLVNDPPGEQEAHAVSDLEGDEDVAEVVVERGLLRVGQTGNPPHERQVQQRLDQ